MAQLESADDGEQPKSMAEGDCDVVRSVGDVARGVRGRGVAGREPNARPVGRLSSGEQGDAPVGAEERVGGGPAVEMRTTLRRARRKMRAGVCHSVQRRALGSALARGLEAADVVLDVGVRPHVGVDDRG